MIYRNENPTSLRGQTGLDLAPQHQKETDAVTEAAIVADTVIDAVEVVAHIEAEILEHLVAKDDPRGVSDRIDQRHQKERKVPEPHQLRPLCLL